MPPKSNFTCSNFKFIQQENEEDAEYEKTSPKVRPVEAPSRRGNELNLDLDVTIKIESAASCEDNCSIKPSEVFDAQYENEDLAETSDNEDSGLDSNSAVPIYDTEAPCEKEDSAETSEPCVDEGSTESDGNGDSDEEPSE